MVFLVATLAPSVDRLVGRRLARIRTETGGRQTDLAAAARRRGLRWSQATVAGIETGRRALSLEEMLLLPELVTFGYGIDLCLADLFTGDEEVELGDRSYRADAVGKVLRGEQLVDLEDRRFTDRGAAAARAAAVHEAMNLATPEALASVGPLLVYDDLERAVARKLQKDPLVVVYAAQRRFERRLSEERDARVEKIATGASRRSLQAARGHVTRALMEELRETIASGQHDEEGS
jgi:transcriptional regulator with XRE-family HTH domain